MKTIKSYHHLVQDVLIIFFSLLIALLLIKTDVLTNILASSQKLGYLGSFIAGMFFTSVFTTVPAMVTLGEIAQFAPALSTAFFGALGAMIIDLALFLFVKDKLSQHFHEARQQTSRKKKLYFLVLVRSYRWLTILIAGFIIASPLPDELAVSLLGFSKLKNSLFMLISFFFNFLGILLIVLAAQSLF